MFPDTFSVAVKQEDADAAVRRRLSELKGKRGRLSALARALKVRPASVTEWVQGKYNPPLDKVSRIASFCGMSLPEFFSSDRRAPLEVASNHFAQPVETNVSGFSAVPLATGRIAAGEPLIIEDTEMIGALAFRDDFVSKRGEPICVRVGPREESMVPVVVPGDVVLLECDHKKIQAIREDRIYAVRLDGGAMLKRLELVKEPGSAWLACISDNPDKVKYKTRLLPIQEGQSWLDYIIGEVVWRGQYIGGKR